jgi:hypothetical protein
MLRVRKMTIREVKLAIKKLHRSTSALAIPVTFMIIFVTMLGIISVTYYLAVERVNTGSQRLKVSMATENMYSLGNAVYSVLWQPGSSRTLEVGDYGGTLNVEPLSNSLFINATDGHNFSSTIFNETIGEVAYQLPYADSIDTGLFLQGDSRPIVNQSGPEITQMSIQSAIPHPEIVLCYRPITSVTSETENNITTNDLSIYIVNLNSSQEITVSGEIPLIISCTTIESTVTTYNIPYQANSLTITAILSGTTGQVSVPLVGDANGTTINVTLMLCNIQINEWIE